MINKQISVFIENKKGTILSVFEILKKEKIQIIASTIADTADNGIFRIICSDPGKGCEALRASGLTASLADVFAVVLDDVPGRAADTISIFTQNGISISYLYSFLLDGKGILIFRTADTEKAQEIIKKFNIQTYEK